MLQRFFTRAIESSRFEGSEFRKFRARLNKTSGGLGEIGAVSGSDCKILKFLRTTFCLCRKTNFQSIRQSQARTFQPVHR